MANNTDDTGKPASRPGDPPGGKRPYATIDAKATEIGPSTSRASASAAAGASSQSESWPDDAPSGPGLGARAAAGFAILGERLRSLPFLTHAAAGALGGLLVLAAALVLLPERSAAPARAPEVGDLTRRLADVEGVLGMRPGGAAGLRARVDELSRSVGGLGEVQAKLARETKALDGKIGAGPQPSSEQATRLTKLEETIAALSSATQSGQPPEVAAIAARLADVEKVAGTVDAAAKSGAARIDSELAAIRTEAGRLAQRLDGIRGEVEERMKGAAMAADVKPIAGKVSTIESDLKVFLRSEADRNASASRVMLALELAGLKRAVDRGEPFAEELARAKRLGGFTIDFTILERYMREGVPTQPELVKAFGKVATAMIDAEAEQPNATVLDRLLSGARGIVRVRKSGHAPDDTSVEAVVGRMETALKDGRLGEVLAQAKTLPPKAALAGEDWLRKIEARHAVDQALADAEAALKAGIGAAAPPAEGKR